MEGQRVNPMLAVELAKLARPVRRALEQPPEKATEEHHDPSPARRSRFARDMDDSLHLAAIVAGIIPQARARSSARPLDGARYGCRACVSRARPGARCRC